MKRKLANYPDWEDVEKTIFTKLYVKEDDFVGDVCLLHIIKAKEKLIVETENGKSCIMDDEFKWVEFYPENDKQIALTATYNNENELFEWYFDICKDKDYTEDGIPYIDDLYLDVVMFASGDIIDLDEDELQEALNIGDITKEDFEEAYKVSKRIHQMIKGKKDQMREFCDKYLNRLLEEEKNEGRVNK